MNQTLLSLSNMLTGIAYRDMVLSEREREREREEREREREGLVVGAPFEHCAM